MIPIPGWLTLKLALAAVVCVACFTAGFQVRGWWAERQEIKAYRMQIEQLRQQADADRATLVEREKVLQEIETHATEWRRKYRRLQQQDKAIQDWVDMPHPPAVGDLLRDTPPGMPGERDTAPRPSPGSTLLWNYERGFGDLLPRPERGVGAV